MAWSIGLLLKINAKFTSTMIEVTTLRTDVTAVQGKVAEHHDYIVYHKGVDAAREATGRKPTVRLATGEHG
jgi:hypothetical protein